MEESVEAAKEYKDRALRAIGEARTHLEKDFLETGVSTAYYACFYSVHSRLAALGAVASSHKQTGIQFRRHFIKNGKLPPRFGETWQKLSEWRMEADYAPVPDIDRNRAKELVTLAEEFVTQVLES